MGTGREEVGTDPAAGTDRTRIPTGTMGRGLAIVDLTIVLRIPTTRAPLCPRSPSCIR